MPKDFLKIPLEVSLVTTQKQLKRSSMSESVAGLIHLVTITQFGENKEDESFGNKLWENDFENITDVQAFKEQMTRSLEATITLHEKRLAHVKVSVAVEQVLTTVTNRRVKQRIQITVEGALRKTNEPFKHREVFFMGPLSYY